MSFHVVSVAPYRGTEASRSPETEAQLSERRLLRIDDHIYGDPNVAPTCESLGGEMLVDGYRTDGAVN